MSKWVDRVRARLAKRDREGALTLLVPAWSERPAAELADLIDVIEGAEPFTGSTKAWLAAAKRARHLERGQLLRAIGGRTADDTLRCLALAARWRDPRLTWTLFQLLAKLPWAGARSRDSWRTIFELVASHGDSRFAALAETLPATWQVGDSMQTWLANQLAAAIAELEPTSHPDREALVTLTRELRAAVPPAPGPPATEQALLAAIYANCDDDGPRLVYADWLQERGDPRGELIALQLSASLDPAARKRERELLKTHRKAWLGPLAAVLRGEVEYRRGFPAKATVTFRHQRDVEMIQTEPAWSTLEDLDWGHPQVRHDQLAWSRFVLPAMTGLRIARGPSRKALLAATRPWRLRRLELAADELDAATFGELARSPLLPALDELWIHGHGSRPAWLAGVTRCPPQLEFNASLDDDELARWLEAARPTPVQRFVLHGYPRYVSHFTRDPDGAFTRLDIAIDLFGRPTSLEPIPRHVTELIEDLRALPAGSLTHFAATIELRGVRVPAAPVVQVGRSKLRG